MNFELSPQASAYPAEDARALLSRLYREIGVAAVAAALDVPARSAEPGRLMVSDIPAVLRDKVRAA